MATKLVEEFVARFGVPLELHSDQGREFESAVFGEMCSLLGVKKTRTSPYHPRSDGINRTIEVMLRVWVDQSQTDRDEHLVLLAMAYRSSEHETTKETLNAMMLGREVRMPVDLLVEPIPVNVPTATTAYAQNLQDKLVTAYEIARENTSSSVTQVGSNTESLQCGSLCGRVCDRMADTGGKENFLV